MERSATRRIAVPVVLAVLVIVGTAACGYALGRASGEDLTAARDAGRASGQQAGAARGAERGYRAGLKNGERQAYRLAYRQARERTINAGRGEIAAQPVNRSCGNLVESGAGSYNVQSVNVICDIALQVARQWEMECAITPEGDCTVRTGFFCDYTQTGYELGTIACTNGTRQVTFETGA
jgi:hypothetical protein